MTQEHTLKEMEQRNYLDSVLDGSLKLQRTQLSINIFLTEKFLGKCWHDYAPTFFGPNFTESTCLKCRHKTSVYTSDEYDLGVRSGGYDLFTPDGFFILWEKAQEQAWWSKFEAEYILKKSYQLITGHERTTFIRATVNPLTFPALLAEYLGWRE